MRASDIATRFSCSWPTTSRHLKVLEEAGLVAVTQEGRERFYELETDHLESVVGDWLAAFRR
jgi:DNA-binding transcriptional ArsR family regulator